MNQPPPTEQQTGKRIVSKGDYVKVWGKRIGLLCFSITTFFCASLVLAFVLTEMQINDHTPPGRRFENQVSALTTILCISLVCIFFYALNKMTDIVGKKVLSLDPGVPLTRANTADLPAPDTLVRASAEPVQETQAMLLRAATESMERHEEQLVRAVEATPVENTTVTYSTV